MNGAEMRYINDAFESNWIAPLGANVDLLERRVCEYLKCNGATALSSGTAAIHLALRYLGVERGDVVFCSALTFAASCMPILYEGAEPVFIDSELDSWNMSPDALRSAMSDYAALGRLPKAVVVVDLYGIPANYDAIQAICSEFGVPILEDAAEALGSSYRGRMCGTLGALGVLSFNANKIITTSGGGMIVTDDTAAAEKTKFWATQSREPVAYYLHREVGYNYRLSNISAGIGCGQMETIAGFVNRRREVNAFYREAFRSLPVTFPTAPEGSVPNCWLSVLTIDCAVSPTDVIDALERCNIEARRCWNPMNRQPKFDGCKFYAVQTDGYSSVGETLFEKGICLPSGTAMSDAELDRIADCVRATIGD
jgi:pyridoxal phosphate-dependent aminotransferase EpsN